jgi:apolipoprotein N-acyltransferase
MVSASSDGISLQAQDWLHSILLADGWRRRGIAVGAGIVAALAMQPIDLLPAFLVSFPLLVLLLDGTGDATRPTASSLLTAGTIGWWFGFGYFVAGLWWLGAAFVAGGDQFIWLMPLGVIGLPAVLAFFPALGLMIARVLWSRGPSRIFALAFGLGLSEWLRGWLFTGFPWNTVGQAFANHLVLAQIVSVIGSDGLGLIAIALFATPALVLTGFPGRARWLPVVLAAAILSGIACYGFLRLQASGGTGVDFGTMPLVPNVKLRIMQPNVAQDAKNAGRDGLEELSQFLALSDTAKGAHASGVADATHLIWPEAPFAFVLERKAQALEMIRRFLPASTILITGAVRAEPREGEARGFRFFNSIQVLDRTGIIATYDKAHLVPFGEFLPFERLLRAVGLQEFVHVIGGFTASPARRPLAIPGLPPVTPMICFETIFSRELGGSVGGDGVFINVTNDAWFGFTFGPHQHLAQARLRAIEYGLPMIRAANSGISTVFDPFGRKIAALPLGVADVLDSPLPTGLSKTLYRLSGWYSFVSVMVLFLIIALASRNRP